MQTDNNQNQEHEDEQEKLTFADIVLRIRKTLTSALAIAAIVTVCSIIYGLIAQRRFTIEYVFIANFAVSAVLIAAGLLLPLAPNRFVDKLRNRQLVESTMHKDFMESRAKKQKQGYGIMWIGLASGMIAGLIEVIIWLT